MYVGDPLVDIKKEIAARVCKKDRALLLLTLT